MAQKSTPTKWSNFQLAEFGKKFTQSVTHQGKFVLVYHLLNVQVLITYFIVILFRPKHVTPVRVISISLCAFCVLQAHIINPYQQSLMLY